MSEDTNETSAVDLGALGAFDFTPDWAKGDASDHSAYKKFEDRDGGDRERTPGGREDRPRRDGRRDDRPRRSSNFDRRSVDGTMGGDDRPRRDRKEADRQDRPPRADNGERRPFRNSGRRDRPFIKAMEADIRILPNQKDLGQIIRKIQTTHQAYPLKQLAYFFLDHPASCILRITPKKPENGEEIVFHQCKACGFAALTEEELVAHAVQNHLSDYFETDVVDCEPPKGTFTCVAKCGLTGELIGPPNHHGYDSKIREMLRTRFPNMREDDYRAKLVMLRDNESIEAWRASAVKKTVYRKKGIENAPALEREQAELEFRQTFLPGILSTARTINMTAEKALATPIKPLLFACRDALAKERRLPANLCYALRGAFHYRKLVLFRANEPRGMEFVSCAKPVRFDASNAVPELVTLLETAEKMPCVPAAEIIAAASNGDESKKAIFATHLAWLVEKGNLVQFFNGLVSPAAENPRYVLPRRKKPGQDENTAAKENPAAEEPAPAVEAPAPVAEETPSPAEAPAAEEAAAAEPPANS